MKEEIHRLEICLVYAFFNHMILSRLISFILIKKECSCCV